MEKPKISIIVPVYNVEKYLHKCIDSILAQSFTDYEMLLVDDGSTDASGRICDKYESKDKRIRVIHKQNGGLSDARNAGIDLAKGNYLGFVDSDDYIAPDMYELLYNQLVEYDADFSTCGVYNCYESRIVPQYPYEESFCTNAQEAYRLLLQGNKIAGTICNKLFTKEMFEKIRFPKGKLYEDAFATIQLIQLAQKVAVSTEPKYYYVHRPASITTASFSPRDLDIIEAYTENLKMVCNKFPALERQAYFRYYWAYFCVLDKMLMVPDFKKLPQYKQVIGVLKKNAFRIAANPCFQKSRRIAACVLFFNAGLYKKLAQMNEEKNKKLVS